MTRARPLDSRPETGPHASRVRWWLLPGALGVVLLLVPVLAPVVTNRDPDPLFLHAWWSPIASVPSGALLLGSVGLDLVVATGIAALAVRLAAVRWRVPRHLPIVVTVALALAGGVGWVGVTQPHADASAAAIRAARGGQGPATATSTSEARRAIRLALGLPGSSTEHVRVLSRSSTPAGPWLVQTTEVLNPNLQDEGAEVTVGTLVDPTTGSIEAAWFYGL